MGRVKSLFSRRTADSRPSPCTLDIVVSIESCGSDAHKTLDNQPLLSKS